MLGIPKTDVKGCFIKSNIIASAPQTLVPTVAGVWGAFVSYISLFGYKTHTLTLIFDDTTPPANFTLGIKVYQGSDETYSEPRTIFSNYSSPTAEPMVVTIGLGGTALVGESFERVTFHYKNEDILPVTVNIFSIASVG